MLTRIFDVLFPRACAGCGRGPWPFCHECISTLRPISGPICSRCGAPARSAVPTCANCPPGEIHRSRAPFEYEGAIRNAILRLKFSGDVAIADALAGAMATSGEFCSGAITWVPLSRARMSERGFDQARALALALSTRVRIPAVPLLRRVANAGPQAKRSGEQRRKAMKGLFEVLAGPVPPHVLLVDDVLTTGATAAECSRMLLAAGARRIDLVVAARALARPGSRGYSR